MITDHMWGFFKVKISISESRATCSDGDACVSLLFLFSFLQIGILKTLGRRSNWY